MKPQNDEGGRMKLDEKVYVSQLDVCRAYGFTRRQFGKMKALLEPVLLPGYSYPKYLRWVVVQKLGEPGR
jgi:hypothetical protein